MGLETYGESGGDGIRTCDQGLMSSQSAHQATASWSICQRGFLPDCLASSLLDFPFRASEHCADHIISRSA
jgi:hypothetical protein